MCRSWPRLVRSTETVKTGPCKEVIRRENFLSRISGPSVWPKDAERFTTWPLVITPIRKTGKRNVGVYRMQIYDDGRRGCTGNAEAGAEHFAPRRAAKTRRRIDSAVAIGSDPVTSVGILPIPPDRTK